ncbi:MAG: tRNA lysidine(34) synthetase TilS [Oscillospiraceae bacterium]|nr:tRNA lysidine(34) synthetase TilS [Oscillospiraceae bacterium]
MGMELIESVKTAIVENNMLRGGETAVCALSGGADSTALLLVLKELSGEIGFKLKACHLNHGLRGEESDRDESFCAKLCESLGIELYRKKINVRDHAKKHESVEETARKLRYRFFEEARERFGENSLTATAHNANDSTETVLLNLVRGTGLKGLCGIPPVRDKVIRPLIYAKRSEIEEFLKERGQTFVTDSTNFSEDYTRNKIRLKLLPEILEINPSAIEAFSRMSKILRGDSDYLESLAENAFAGAKRQNGYDALELFKLEEPIKSRAIRKILIDGGVEPSELRIKTALSLLSKRSARYNPCKNKFFTIRKGICFIENIEQKFGGFNEKHD